MGNTTVAQAMTHHQRRVYIITRNLPAHTEERSVDRRSVEALIEGRNTSRDEFYLWPANGSALADVHQLVQGEIVGCRQVKEGTGLGGNKAECPSDVRDESPGPVEIGLRARGILCTDHRNPRDIELCRFRTGT